MEHVIEVLSGVLAALAHNSAAPYVRQEEVAYGIAGVASLVFSFSAQQLVRMVRMTMMFDWRFKVAGTWIESVDHDSGRQYSMSEISFNHETGEFEIVGHTFIDGSFEVFSEWRSLSVSFPEKNSLYYIYSLRNYRVSPTDSRPLDVIGIAHMSFFVQGSGRQFFDGQGYFLDQISQANEITYHFRRIDNALIHKLIGKKRISTTDERKLFLSEYSRQGLSWTQYNRNVTCQPPDLSTIA